MNRREFMKSAGTAVAVAAISPLTGIAGVVGDGKKPNVVFVF